MRKNWLIVVLATVLTLIAAFALVSLASAAGSSGRPQESSAAAALQAKTAPAAAATPSGAMGSGRPTPTPTRKPAAKRKPTATATIPAPRLQDYRDETFSWKWDGAKQAGKQDWYFDIQFYQGSAQDPYHIIAAEKTKVRLDQGIWYYKEAPRLDCSSFWVVQIAKRLNGKFAGWISPKSDRLPIGESCGPVDPCPGCGGGSQ